jgi:hypothetical protein
VLAVETQTASPFFSTAARNADIGVVAHVTSAINHPDEQFDKSTDEDGFNFSDHTGCAWIHSIR